MTVSLTLLYDKRNIFNFLLSDNPFHRFISTEKSCWYLFHNISKLCILHGALTLLGLIIPITVILKKTKYVLNQIPKTNKLIKNITMIENILYKKSARIILTLFLIDESMYFRLSRGVHHCNP